MNGLVLAGSGSDTLAFAGTGNGTFDLDNIDTGAGTQQYRDFENFTVESEIWFLVGRDHGGFDVTGGTMTWATLYLAA